MEVALKLVINVADNGAETGWTKKEKVRIILNKSNHKAWLIIDSLLSLRFQQCYFEPSNVSGSSPLTDHRNKIAIQIQKYLIYSSASTLQGFLTSLGC